MYASGQRTDRTLAEWLNVNEQRTARDRAFGVDTFARCSATPPTPATSPGTVTSARPSGAYTSRSSTRRCSTGCRECATSAHAR